jgi:hypothetical protein
MKSKQKNKKTYAEKLIEESIELGRLTKEELGAIKSQVKFDYESKITPIELLGLLIGQTDELIKQNEKKSSLTKWLIFLTSILAILTVVLTYFSATSLG